MMMNVHIIFSKNTTTTDITSITMQMLNAVYQSSDVKSKSNCKKRQTYKFEFHNAIGPQITPTTTRVSRYSPMATDLATLATSSIVNPFAPPHSQLTSKLSGMSDQSAAALMAAGAASILPALTHNASLKTAFIEGTGVGSGTSGGFGAIRAGGSGNSGGSGRGSCYITPTALDHHAHRLAAAAAAGNLSGWCLFVYNLAPEVEENVIWKLFGPFGAVQQVNLVKDVQTNKCRGFAFVTMSDYNQALMAIQSLNGYTLANRVLQVSFKTSKVRKTAP